MFIIKGWDTHLVNLYRVFFFEDFTYVCLLDFYDIFREDSSVLDEAGIDTMKASETDRKSDAMTVKRAFALNRKV